MALGSCGSGPVDDPGLRQSLPLLEQGRARHGPAVQALRAPGMKERLLNEGTEVVANSPQEFDAFTRKELAKYEKLVKAANIKPE